MILAIDVGNTNIVLGGIEEGKQVFSARLASDRNKTEDHCDQRGGLDPDVFGPKQIVKRQQDQEDA